MKSIFVDTNHFTALLNLKDQWHVCAIAVEDEVRLAGKITIEMVLLEVLNYFSGYRPEVRQGIAGVVRRILSDDEIEVVLHTHAMFADGMALYEARLDKGYSLTDCISMNVMRQRGISDVLTHDNHFRQEGFQRAAVNRLLQRNSVSTASITNI